MYSILKILLGLKLTLILIIISAGAGMIIERSFPVKYIQGSEYYYANPTSQNQKPIENQEPIPVYSVVKVNSLSDLGLFIEL